jgi:hypothetical protein
MRSYQALLLDDGVHSSCKNGDGAVSTPIATSMNFKPGSSIMSSDQIKSNEEDPDLKINFHQWEYAASGRPGIVSNLLLRCCKKHWSLLGARLLGLPVVWPLEGHPTGIFNLTVGCFHRLLIIAAEFSEAGLMAPGPLLSSTRAMTPVTFMVPCRVTCKRPVQRPCIKLVSLVGQPCVDNLLTHSSLSSFDTLTAQQHSRFHRPTSASRAGSEPSICTALS